MENFIKMEKIYYINLMAFIDMNIKHIEIIKEQYLNLMKELTASPDISKELFYNRVKEINSQGTIVIGYVQTESQIFPYQIVGSGTVIIEPKIIRAGSWVGHIEDIVVKSDYRGKKIAQNILNELTNYAKTFPCYKIILDCAESVCPVYLSNGFEIKGIQMGKYFPIE
jgi:glucosamine-phosphate N-acetyltransferase